MARHVETERVAYRPAEAAEAIGLSERYVRKAIATGELPSSRRGRAVLVLAEDLVGWIRAGRAEPAAPPVAPTERTQRALERLKLVT
jgi:excisionase family DNA binding protein